MVSFVPSAKIDQCEATWGGFLVCNGALIRLASQLRRKWYWTALGMNGYR